jgi:hypothetical protein
MWLCLVGSYAVLLFSLIACAGFISLFVEDDKRRRQAFKVLRLLIATCTSVIAAVALHLNQFGVG